MMDFVSVPIVVVCCYIIGEIYKVVFKDNQKTYKLIPILVSIFGGILGVLIYCTDPQMIFNADNIWGALLVGIISGSSATGTNQIVKQIFKKKEENRND